MSHLGRASAVRPAGMELSRPRRTLALAGVAYALHGGLTDMIYVLLCRSGRRSSRLAMAPWARPRAADSARGWACSRR